MTGSTPSRPRSISSSPPSKTPPKTAAYRRKLCRCPLRTSKKPPRRSALRPRQGARRRSWGWNYQRCEARAPAARSPSTTYAGKDRAKDDRKQRCILRRLELLREVQQGCKHTARGGPDRDGLYPQGDDLVQEQGQALPLPDRDRKEVPG